jgi:DNA-nicking Smr family endonuclease
MIADMGRGSHRPPQWDDEAAFTEAVRGARPLDRRTGRTMPVVPLELARPAPPEPRPAATVAPLELTERWGEHYTLLPPGGDRALVRALRAGEHRPEASLDLHGLDRERARRAARAFIEAAHQRGQRRLLLVHGRGQRSGAAGPVLRDCLLELLAAAPLGPRILAVVDAPPAMGGPGAALVLLRRR